MKRLSLGILQFFVFIVVINIQGCVEDSVSNSTEFDIINAAEFLYFLEEQGDFVNSEEAPGNILAEEVYSNLDNYLIIDIRTRDVYSLGHIPNSINLQPSHFIEYLQSIDTNSYEKIVLVSISGQSAAYYCCLLRMYGFNNVYVLKYGMASWHIDFAEIWLQAARTTDILDQFVNIDYPKGTVKPLPQVAVSNSTQTLQEKLRGRINSLIQLDFVENDHFNIFTDLSITLDELYQNYQPSDSSFPGFYIVCLGDDDIYIDHARGRLWEDGHPPTTVLIRAVNPHWEMRSGKYLQTLPHDETIVVYCYDGHLSACFTAYLRILGYNVKSMLFGYNTLYHNRMLRYPVLEEKAFTAARIGNYNYETGN
ncbi:rhodanese-like domain-containing protein [Bacteroidota bacterium]